MYYQIQFEINNKKVPRHVDRISGYTLSVLHPEHVCCLLGLFSPCGLKVESEKGAPLYNTSYSLVSSAVFSNVCLKFSIYPALCDR